jgi:hypothetical protein
MSSLTDKFEELEVIRNELVEEIYKYIQDNDKWDSNLEDLATDIKRTFELEMALEGIMSLIVAAIAKHLNDE